MNIPILMYHQIDVPPASGTPLRGLVVAPAAFARQMWLLRLFGYKGLSMSDLVPYLKGEKRGKVVGLTFDDGYQNNVGNALPVLKKNGFTATCYGVSGMMSGTNSWDLEKGIAEKPLMTLSDWQGWRDAGMDIGSHTRTHANLTELPSEEARQQIAASKHELEFALDSEVRHFCYPYGKFLPEHAAMVKEAGYVTATTVQRGRVHEGADPFTLRRIMVARATHPGLFAAKVMTDYEDRRA
ncbi:MAG: polysaccharide deacetylase family protein [Burkholderiaceae bacterium]